MPPDSPPHLSNRLISLLLSSTLLLILLGLWLLFYYDPPFALQNAYSQPSASVTPTATASLTATLTPTFTPTPRPSWTLRPSDSPTPTVTGTATLTPTPVRLATLAVAVPYKYNDRYQLATYTAALADEATRRMSEYPDIKYPNLAQRSNESYNIAYTAAVLAYREALLRLPEAPQAGKWRWGLAYALARLGSAEAAEMYTEFLQQPLQAGNMLPADLPDWFHSQEPRLSLLVYALPPQPGDLERLLLYLPEGQAFFYLHRTPNSIRVYPLTRVFNFLHAERGAYWFGDLTGDGLEEIALYQGNLPNELQQPQIFSLVELPPLLMPVAARPVIDFKLDAAPALQAAAGGEQALSLSATLYPACPLAFSERYRWDGSRFNFEPPVYSYLPNSNTLNRCQALLEHGLAFWQPPAVLPLLQTLLPLWPPKLDTQGRLYPADAADRLRYQSAVQLALDGQNSAAVRGFDEIGAAPATADSPWIEPARRFSQALNDPQRGLYRACQESPECNLRRALESVIRQSAAATPALAVQALVTAGVPIRANSVFDFNQDGVMERWLTVQPQPRDQLDLWLLAVNPAGQVQALLVKSVDDADPKPYFSILPWPNPVFQLEARQGYSLVEIGDDLALTEFTIEPALTTYTRDTLLQAQNRLLNGENPRQVRLDLEVLRNSGRFNCKTDAVCDLYYYLVGLSYELSGQDRLAVDAYIQLWWEQKLSPLTTLARLRLIFFPPGTPRFSPTPTITATVTPTFTLTPTVTHTPDPNASPTPTASETATATPTPTLTATASETPTPTITP